MKEGVMRSKALKTVSALCVIGAAFAISVAAASAWVPGSPECQGVDLTQHPDCAPPTTTLPPAGAPQPTTTGPTKVPATPPDATTVTATVPITNLPPKGDVQKKSPAPADQPSVASSTANGQLPFTGVNVGLLALAGAVLLFAGAALIKLERGK